MSEIPIDPILKVLGLVVKKIVEKSDFGLKNGPFGPKYGPVVGNGLLLWAQSSSYSSGQMGG